MVRYKKTTAVRDEVLANLNALSVVNTILPARLGLGNSFYCFSDYVFSPICNIVLVGILRSMDNKFLVVAFWQNIIVHPFIEQVKDMFIFLAQIFQKCLAGSKSFDYAHFFDC